MELGGHTHDEVTDAIGKPSRTALVDMAKRRFRFGVGEQGQVFAAARTRPHLTMGLDGGAVRGALAAAYYEETHKAPKGSDVKDALVVLEGQAVGESPERLHLRVAEHVDGVWIDMGDPKGRVIHLQPGSWEIVAGEVPVIFQRSALTGQMPTPTREGRVDAVWEFVNVDAADRPLVLAWLVSALACPGIAHPILAVFGEQGTGKSTSSGILMSLFDPSPVPVRKPPTNVDTWVVAASGSYGVALDNLSEVRPWLSDSLCRAVTGDADVRRMLYTDGGLAVFAFRRVILLNGIDVGSLNGDLAERVIELRLPLITGEGRRLEADILGKWKSHHPAVMGGLLDLASQVLEILPTIEVPQLPRMADFARILAAVDKIKGTQGLARYREATASAIGSAAHDSPFVEPMMSQLDAPFHGTSAKLLSRIRRPDDSATARDWPKDARAVTTALRRAAPGLRLLGWAVQDDEARNKDKVIRWSITPSDDQQGDRLSDPEEDEW